MSYTGTVERGVVKLPPDAVLPEGTKVRIEPIESLEAATTLHQRWVDEGLASGPAASKSQADWDALKDRALRHERK